MIYDIAGQERIYVEYHPKVLKYITARVSNRSDAEDLASNVFLKVFKNLSGFDSERASISTWIYTITRNTLIDYFRKLNIDSPLYDNEIASENVEETILSEELLEALAAALENLEERERDIIVLRYYDGKTLGDIASLMNISYSYVKILHKKAIEKLRTVLL